MTRTTAIDGYEGFDSEGSLALQIGGDDVLHLRAVAPHEASNRLTDDQHQAVNDAVLAALGLIDNPLLAALRAILPYAESRAEDMLECAEEAEDRAKLSPNGRPLGSDTTIAQNAQDARSLADKAVAAVDAAKALLASLEAPANGQ